MNLHFPLSDVEIALGGEKMQVEYPLYEDIYYKLNQDEFSMEVQDVGWFFASKGVKVQIVPEPGVSAANLELYLNGSTFGAILHQRGILPLHGSSFVFEEKGILLCGDSGAGKSSLTAAFVLEGNEFLTDDVSPIVFQEGKPWIWAISDRVKLWEDSLAQLSQSYQNLDPIDPQTQKFYFPMQHNLANKFPIHHIFLLEVQDLENQDLVFQDLKGSEKITALRKEIYRLEYLIGMPKNESLFFLQLVTISKGVRMTKVTRPRNSSIKETKEKLIGFLHSQ